MKNVKWLFILIVILLVACEKKGIIDEMTPEQPPVIEATDQMFTIDYSADGMARTKLEYITNENRKLVIDPNFYQYNEFRRGDVIYYLSPSLSNNSDSIPKPPKSNIARVIGLPGETIKIKKGQIYIDEKKLNTFYGKALSWGLDEKQYFKVMNKPGSGVCDEACEKTMKDFFNTNMASTQVPANHLFVLGDTWFRSIDSQFFGALDQGNVVGKVLGYEQSK
ncbi:signal peptidase I [Cohnella herbarum]|uniref:Signal peptidase I n=1 Tax=Cohnella herbarum TaxID=2728023 RepID=A0A7Z2ZKA4_9BACL|nr:signal peptidase I [Cohnella herbarum]QJD82763.1 signal peptidase I [Cohnella herbarum]